MGDIVGGRGLKETEEVAGGLPMCSLLNEGERNFVRREEAMILEGDFQAMQVLKRQGLKKRKVAQLLGLDRKTIQKYWEKADGVFRKQGKGTGERLEPYREYLLKRAPETDYCAAVLFLDLKQLGYEGCYETVKVFIRPLREERKRLEEATIRFETGPGKQAQVDWGSTAIVLSGERIRIHLFVLVLGYSRRMYAVASRDEKLPSFLDAHERAFQWFGGVTQTILYDNPKTVCLTRDFEGKEIGWNLTFRDFARYWGYEPRLCKPYRARTKGKVESGVKYVKRNFFALYGRTFHALEEINETLERWCLEVADERIHGTTHEKPRVRFQGEALMPIKGRSPYRLEMPITRIIPSDALVVYKTNRYSVPWAFVGKEAVLEEQGEQMKIYVESGLIAEHPLLRGRFQQHVIAGHYKGMFQQPKPIRESTGLTSVGFCAKAHEEVEIRDLASYEVLAIPTGRQAAGGAP